ncbi:hypothetical protein [Acetobacterium sp. UBA5834]|jgi:hypothetical protein|uniref:hypothetical protein n=1 Tax=Acetobacterium sp. UBA5834 TaxID=1945907 RepID=UPI002579B910|nr:hypothetical protein [Acetobacterium sp. UBA5834]
MNKESVNQSETSIAAGLTELLDWLLPLKLTQSAELEATMVRGFIDENGQLWLETDELGIFSVEFFIALVMAENLSGGCDEHQ